MNNRIINRFKSNALGFGRKNVWFIMVFLIALLCDAISTSYFMLSDQQYHMQEIHPAVNMAAKWLGPILGPLLGFMGKAGAGLVVGVYLGRWARYLFVTASIISLWAAWYNIWGVHSGYIPNIFKIIPL